MSRTAYEISRDAKKLGEQVAAGQTPSANAVQVLCAYIEELSQRVDELEKRITALPKK